MSRFAIFACSTVALIDGINAIIHVRRTWFPNAPWDLYTPWPGWAYAIFAVFFAHLAIKFARRRNA